MVEQEKENQGNQGNPEQYLKFLPELYEESSYTFEQIKKEMDKGNHSKNLFLGFKKYFIDAFINNTIETSPINIRDIGVTEIAHTSLLVPYFREKKEDRKIYVIQKEFFTKFKDVDLMDLCFKHLPKKLTGYIELPETIVDTDGMKIKGFFFYIGPMNETVNSVWRPKQPKPYATTEDIIGFAYCDDKLEINAFSWTHIPVDGNVKIIESQKEVKTIVMDITGEKQGVTSGYPKFLAVMYNLLAYLNTGEPDIRLFRNKLRYQSPTSKTPIKADKHLSNSGIIQVGYSYKKERLSHTDEWYVMPYMRWQRCGAGLTDIKLVYVKGHTKKRIGT